MRPQTLPGLVLAFVVPWAAAQPRASGCDSLGNVLFICGLVGPEDLVAVPGSDWVIASGDAAPGAITLISKDAK